MGPTSESPTGAEKFLPSMLPSASNSMAASWTQQLENLSQLSRTGATPPLPALRAGMAAGLGYSLANGVGLPGLDGQFNIANGPLAAMVGSIGIPAFGGSLSLALAAGDSPQVPARAQGQEQSQPGGTALEGVFQAKQTPASRQPDGSFVQPRQLEGPYSSVLGFGSGVSAGLVGRGWLDDDDAQGIAVEEDYHSWLADDY